VTEDETFYGRTKPIAYRVSGKCWVNNHAHVLRAVAPVPTDYLSQSLMHYHVIPWLSGTTGRAKLTQGALNVLPIAIAPAAEMAVIALKVADLLAFSDAIAKTVAQMEEPQRLVNQSILAKAFRGELVPQDPNDEPAQVLLDRIRRERDGQGAPIAKRGRGRSSASADQEAHPSKGLGKGAKR
jgi:type I restriction enzyme S subunit